MKLDRRDFLRCGLMTGAAATLSTSAFLRTLRAAPGVGGVNLVLIELFGGNDGYNTIVPFGVDGGAYYTLYRGAIAVPENEVLKITGQPIGFHPQMGALKALYDQGRVAIVQGVSYPDSSFSHEVAQRDWHSGTPGVLGQTGWLGRYLGLYPAPAFPYAAELESQLQLVTAGASGFVPAIPYLDDFTFPIDPYHVEDGANRKSTYLALANAAKLAAGRLGSIAGVGADLLQLIDAFQSVPVFNHVGAYPEHGFADTLKLCARLMNSGLGLQIFHCGLGGFDTHADQNVDGYHGNLLEVLSQSIAALHADLSSVNLASTTVFVVFSEFGRTLYQNGSLGCDHGTVNPVLIVGDPVVGHGGVVNPHVSLDPGNLTEANEAVTAVDFRDVFGTVVKRHLGESGANLAAVFPNHTVTDLGFLG
ncbi:MAG: DUF1501 domain-containing protein [Planctomycetes bacterium]|nr:DUF1501 domain-containing protein [Planctomycetota bacterium]